MPFTHPSQLTLSEIQATRDSYVGSTFAGNRVDLPDGSSYYTATDRIACVAFAGRALKPAFKYRYRSIEQRDEHIARWIQGRTEHAKRKAERLCERRSETHSLKLGDILVSTWGYEQTNVEFYEVTRVVSLRSVEIRELAQERKETLWLQGTSMPCRGKYVGGTMVKRASKTGWVRLADYSSAGPWDGRPVSWSAYA